jgi:hypothetical protein
VLIWVVDTAKLICLALLHPLLFSTLAQTLPLTAWDIGFVIKKIIICTS